MHLPGSWVVIQGFDAQWDCDYCHQWAVLFYDSVVYDQDQIYGNQTSHVPLVNFSYPPVGKSSVTSCLHLTHIHFLIFMFCLYSPFFAFIIKLSIIPCLHIPTDILVIPFITFPLICSVTPLLHFLSNKLDNSPPLPFRFICSVIYLLHLPTALLCNSSPSPSHWYVL